MVQYVLLLTNFPNDFSVSLPIFAILFSVYKVSQINLTPGQWCSHTRANPGLAWVKFAWARVKISTQYHMQP